MSRNSKAAKVSLVGGSTNSAAATTTPTPITNYQRFDPPLNNNLSYDSEDSYRSVNSQRPYTSYNYMSTSIRDRIYYNNNQYHINTNNNNNNSNATTRSNISTTPLAPNSDQQQQQQQQLLLTEEDQQRIQYLALRKFHIPGHTFTQDYIYW
jgi:hypothetical protein